jgi:pimeloyl-ACP methyl ester carboxylesterase
MNKNQKILCFPGWSYSLNIKEWFGLPVDCINHYDQVELFIDEVKLKSLLPKNEEWGLITWSMGTWMGLMLNELWQDNPPSFWIALAPFTNFCGENAVDEKELKLLQKSFKRKPRETLEHFRKKHGGLSYLKEEAIADTDLNVLKSSLDMLSNTPIVNIEISCPVLIVYGEEDTLVKKSMVESFKAKCSNVEIKVGDNLTHELLYEMPPSIKNDIHNFVNKTH